MFKIFRRCKHKNTTTITNIYGDPINYFDARSLRICNDCHKLIYSDYLDKNCDKANEFP